MNGRKLQTLIGKNLRIGEIWENITSFPGNAQVQSIETGDNGVALLGTSSTTGRIFRTIDYGSNWTAIGQLSTATSISKILYCGNNVWLAGQGATNSNIYRSTDNGLTWGNAVAVGSGTAIKTMIRLSNGDILVGLTSNPAQVYRSTDNGQSFNLVLSRTSTAGITAMLDHGNGVVSCFTTADVQLRSSDYGATWGTAATVIDAGSTSALCYLGNNIVIMAKISTVGIYRSTDNGITYTKVYTPTGINQINGFVFISNEIIAIGQSNGVVFKSKDLGLTWESFGQQFSQVFLNTIAAFPTKKILLVGTGSGSLVIRSVPANNHDFNEFVGLHEPQQEVSFVPVIGDKTDGFNQDRSDRVNGVVAAYDQDMVISVGDIEKEVSTTDCDDTLLGLEEYKNTAFYCAYGNHDLERRSTGAWTVNDHYGKISFGDIDFFIIDQYLSPLDNTTILTGVEVVSITLAQFQAGVQGQWLISELANSTAKWKIIVMHDFDNGFMQWNWNEYKVNLILYGDNHTYLHSKRKYYNGTVHALICGITGGSTADSNPILGYTLVKKILNSDPLCNVGNIVKVWSGNNYLHVKMYGVNASNVTEMDHFEISNLV